MMKLMTALAFAVALSAPAAAKEPHKLSPQAAAAQASVQYPSINGNGDYVMDSTVVVVDGEVVGRDPSPDIRASLRRIPRPDVQ